MKTGVVAHGRHLQMLNWEAVMWGKPPAFMGQIPKEALVAIQEGAEIIVFGSGVSEKDGKREAEYIKDYLLERFLELAEFPDFQGIDLARAREKIAKIAVLDVSSLNTAQEVRFSGRIFEEAGIERVISVTSRIHAPRCLNELLKFYSRPESKIAIRNISVQFSDTGWAPNDDVVVLEPPHMPNDLIMGNLRQKVAKMLLQPDKLLEIKKALGF